MFVLLIGMLLLVPSPVQSPDSSARVTGRVLIRGENTPVAGARVTLIRLRRGSFALNGTPPGPPPQTLTRADGTFTFDHLEPGEYGLSAQKTGLAEGPQVQRMTEQLTVAAGQEVRSPDIFLERGGAIAGRILDGNGEPLVDVRVMAMRPPGVPAPPAAIGFRPPADLPMMPAGRSAQTNDLGEFRIFGLLAGEYAVAASLAPQGPFLTASPSSVTLTTTYFPGVTDEHAAQVVKVTTGKTTAGIEIRMATSPAFLVSGVVVTEDGQPVEGAMVVVTSRGVLGAGPRGMSRTDDHGRFQIANVTSGTYQVNCGMTNTGPMASLNIRTPETVTVTDSDVANVRLVVVRRP